MHWQGTQVAFKATVAKVQTLRSRSPTWAEHVPQLDTRETAGPFAVPRKRSEAFASVSARAGLGVRQKEIFADAESLPNNKAKRDRQTSTSSTLQLPAWATPTVKKSDNTGVFLQVVMLCAL